MMFSSPLTNSIMFPPPTTTGWATFLRRIVTREKAHVMAMTGSYFRGDAIPVLRPGR